MKNKRFSIIIPVYNTEKYLKRCLDSVFKQSYNNYEVIVINDGSTDNSEEIIKEYKVKYINQNNQGLSMARNNGVEQAQGDYLIFLDSDDYIDINLLEVLNKKINKEEIVRFQLATFNDNSTNNFHELEFNNLNGRDALKIICTYNFIDNASLYCINKEYWNSNNFCFEKGRYHEDFGIIPEAIFLASSVSSIDFIGNYYYQRDDGIMGNKEYEKDLKKMEDIYFQGINTINRIKSNTKVDRKEIIYNHIINSIFQKLKNLKKDDKIKYINKIKEQELFYLLPNNTLKRKIRNIMYKLKYKL